MAKRVVIVGTCEPNEDAKALKAFARFVSDSQPNEIICSDPSILLAERLREVHDGPLGVHGHAKDDSFKEVLYRSGAALLPEFYEIGPGWVTTHGHHGQISLSRIAGNTALGAAKEFGKSVVMGHTHRLGVLSHTTGYGGRVSAVLTGMEVGYLMSQKLARSVRGQQGFGMLTIDGENVEPEVVAITRGRFTVDGEVWEL